MRVNCIGWPSTFLTFSPSYFALAHANAAAQRRGKIHHQDAKTPREESQGGRGGNGGKGEKILTTEAQRHGGSYEGKRCKAEAQRPRRKERCGLWIIRPCFRPSVGRVMPGHGGKILTTEITEGTEGRCSPQRRGGKRIG
jgi:hypothetical protein